MSASDEAVELLPCPFCGGANIDTYKPALSKLLAVYCYDCEVKGPLANTEATAIAAWNTRAALSPAPTGEDDVLTEAQIKHMAERFLGWRLPEDFNPDGGISFEPVGNKGSPHEYRHNPIGTNLFNATQAEAMVRYMLDGFDAEAQLLNDIAVMMSEFVDNWPQPKKVGTALALIAKTFRALLERLSSPEDVTEADVTEDVALLSEWAEAYIGPECMFPNGGYAGGIQALARVVLAMRSVQQGRG